MADRGRKNQLVCSPILDEKWKKHDYDSHKKRLAGMRHMIDTSEPVSTQHKPSSAKREEIKRTRQEEIDYENHILLEKLINIKNFDSWNAFKPWLARSTFQYSPGTFYDPTTGAKCVDHLNPTAYLSPRSTHAPGRPNTAPTSFYSTQRYLQTLEENSKLLHAIDGTRSAYQISELAKSAAEHALHSRRLSNFRGPESARYVPSPLHVSANLSARKSSGFDPLRPHTEMTPGRHYPMGASSSPASRGQGRRACTAPHPVHQSPLTGTSPTHSPQGSAMAADIHNSGGRGDTGRPPTRPSSKQPALKGDGWMRHQAELAELAELGVLDEEPDDASEFEREIAASRHRVNGAGSGSKPDGSTASAASLTHGSSAASSARPGSARPESARPQSRGSQRTHPTLAPPGLQPPPPAGAAAELPSLMGSAASQASSRAGSAVKPSAGSRNSSRPASSHSQSHSPYLQPVSPQQQARALSGSLSASLTGTQLLPGRGSAGSGAPLSRQASASRLSAHSGTMPQLVQQAKGGSGADSVLHEASMVSLDAGPAGISSLHSSRPSSARSSSARFSTVPILSGKAGMAGGAGGSGAATPSLVLDPAAAAATEQQQQQQQQEQQQEHQVGGALQATPAASMAEQEQVLADALNRSSGGGGRRSPPAEGGQAQEEEEEEAEGPTEAALPLQQQWQQGDEAEGGDGAQAQLQSLEARQGEGGDGGEQEGAAEAEVHTSAGGSSASAAAGEQQHKEGEEEKEEEGPSGGIGGDREEGKQEQWGEGQASGRGHEEEEEEEEEVHHATGGTRSAAWAGESGEVEGPGGQSTEFEGAHYSASSDEGLEGAAVGLGATSVDAAATASSHSSSSESSGLEGRDARAAPAGAEIAAGSRSTSSDEGLEEAAAGMQEEGTAA